MLDDAFFGRARRLAEARMTDSCLITRDPEFVDDSALDPATGVLTPGAPGTVEVYAGKCAVAPSGGQSETDEGGAPIVEGAYAATIPVAAPPVRIGDTLTVVASARDPQLAGQPFTVGSVKVSTHAFHRRLALDLAVRADAQ